MSVSVLWAKKSKDGCDWLPLCAHLKDTAEVAKKLWRKWVPENVKQAIAASIGADEQEAERFFIFLAAVHDIGKATPVFQATRLFPETDLDRRIYDGLLQKGFIVKESRKEYSAYEKTHHAIAAQLLLENANGLGLADANLCINAAVIIGAHHGKPPDDGYSENLGSYKCNFGCSVPDWISVQKELIKLALECSRYKSLAEVHCPTMPGQVLLSGLLIVADWIASGTDKFPLISLDNPLKIDSAKRAQAGWEKLSLPDKWEPCRIRIDEGLYADRFDNVKKPNEIQIAVLELAREIHRPGIMVIEAPMGFGKTEAALTVAEVFRDKAESGGVFFALPTQATSDGIFPRLKEWIEKLDFDSNERHSINLVHGKAQFNDEFTKLQLFEYKAEVSGEDYEERVGFVHQWFNGRKKALLADFVVGTVDQLLLMALKQKHVMLRHLGLAGKIVIIDECHAYDAYMSQYLKMALKWLGAYGVPVIVLSATLPVDTRREVMGAYLDKRNIAGEWARNRDYPLITYTDGGEIKYRTVKLEKKPCNVKIERIAWDAVADKLYDLLSDGGCAGVVMDTVKRAQDMARVLRQRFSADDVRLIHSRFIAADRLTTEKELREILNKDGKRRPQHPEKFIVVGTQVLEQSLDIDFDVLITDIAPMDLLLQRMGRLHRHERGRRPEKLRNPICFITGIDEDGFAKGIDMVYNKYLLTRTKDLLDGRDKVSIPNDIALLVNDAYDKNVELTKEKEEWEKKIEKKVSDATKFCMCEPDTDISETIINWLNTSVDDDEAGKRGEAAVRDSYDSVEVLVIKESGGNFFMMNGTTPLPKSELDDKLARQLARQKLALPRMLSHLETIEELEKNTRKKVPLWQNSPWISGELFLFFDDSNTSTLCGRKLTYTDQDGLRIGDEAN